MATIYDVAKQAHVSVGTVSNYLNNKYVGTARSEAIKEAIERLHYVPNQVARALKVSQSRQIMLILPNISEGIYSELAATIITQMSENGYQVRLEFTGDSPRREQKLMELCFATTYTAIILCTCRPAETEIFEQLQRIKPLLFLLRKPENLADYCFLGFDNFDIVKRITGWFLHAGEASVGLWTGPKDFSCERACIKAFEQAYRDAELSCPEASIYSLPTNKELLFRQATTLFASNNYPKLIIASSRLIADAIIEAAYYQNIILNQNISIISLGEGKWSNAEQLYCNLSTVRSVQGLAQEACRYLMECVQSPGTYEKRVRQIRDEFSVARLTGILDTLKPIPSIKHMRAPSKRLRVVCADCDTGVLSIQYLAPYIAEQSGIDIDLQLLPVYDLLPMTLGECGDSDYDIVHLDNSWMQQVVSKGIIKDISEYFEQRPALANDLVPNLVKSTATIQGRVYGAPSLLCSQMLFYRSDLFEDPVVCNQFSEMYGRPLAPPTTWFELLLIARFFTRSLNPKSPCKYGLIMGMRDAEMMLTEVFPRMWAYGGNVFDDYGNVTLYSDENLQAIRNYIDCLHCCDPAFREILLPQFPVRFAEGNTAMIIAYDIHACNLMNFNSSKVLDKIGFAQIPGGRSVMGGWNFCVNAQSEKVDLCYKFFDAFFSPELAIPYTLLGGGSPRRNVVCSPEVVSMYPWLQFSSEIFQQSTHRVVPQGYGFSNPPEAEVERLLANVVYGAIENPKRLDALLRLAEQELIALRRPV